MPIPQVASDGFYHPANEEEVRALIRRARSEGKVLRVRGAAHSVHGAVFSSSRPSDLPNPNGINLMLDHLRRLEFDDDMMRVTVQAGCNLGRDPVDPSNTSTLGNALFPQLDRRGWAFPDTGGIIHQTVAGFLSTGSSGGSLQHSVADQVVAIHLIDGRGRKHILTEDENAERFRAAGVSMGLLGVITAVTFQCVPAFRVIGQESTILEDDCRIDLFGPGSDDRPSLERFLTETEHTRLLWWPQEGVRRVTVWSGRRMRPKEAQDPQYAEPNPYEEFPEIFGSMFPAQLFGGGFFYLIRYWNSRGIRGKVTRATLRLLLAPFLRIFVSTDGRKGPQPFWDDWWRALPMDNKASDKLLPTEFTEMWLPLSATEEVMRRLRGHYRDHGLAATGPYACEIYATRRSPFWMSPAYERNVVKFDMFWYGHNVGNPAETYYPQFWSLLSDLDYRFHWGKYLSDDSAAYLRRLYPKWDEFMKIREEMDPDQVFVSPYWRKHLRIPLHCARNAPLQLEALHGVECRVWGTIDDDRCRRIITLLDQHMVTENAEDLSGILATLVEEPTFVMEYLPVSLGRWWWTRKVWQGREATIAFYRGLFRNFGSFRVTPIRFTVGQRGVVNAYRLEGRILEGVLGRIGLRGIPVRVPMAAFFGYSESEHRFQGERVYMRERSALKNL